MWLRMPKFIDTHCFVLRLDKFNATRACCMQLGESYILALHCRLPLLDSGKYNHIRSRMQSLTLHKDLAPLPSTASTARESHTSTPPQRYTFSAPPELKNSMPPRLYTCSAPAHLHTYMPPRRYALRSARSELQSSVPSPTTVTRTKRWGYETREGFRCLQERQRMLNPDTLLCRKLFNTTSSLGTTR